MIGKADAIKKGPYVGNGRVHNRWNTGDEMKIKVEGEKIIKAVKKLHGIEMVLENASDAKEAINLVLRRTYLFEGESFAKLKEVAVSALQEYKTSAVDYTMIFLLEFVFNEDVSLDAQVGVIKELQDFFQGV